MFICLDKNLLLFFKNFPVSAWLHLYLPTIYVLINNFLSLEQKKSNFYLIMEKLPKNMSQNQQISSTPSPKCTPCGIYFATKGKLNNHMIDFHMTNR